MPVKRPMPKAERMSARELDETLDKLGLTQEGGAKFLGINVRTMRRWVKKGGANQLAAIRLLRLMIEHGVKPPEEFRRKVAAAE